MENVTVRELSSLLSTLNLTVMPVLPASLYIKYLQSKQIEGLCATKSFDSKVYLDYLSKEELN